MLKQLWPSFLGMLIATPFVFLLDGFVLGSVVIGICILLIVLIYVVVQRAMK